MTLGEITAADLHAALREKRFDERPLKPAMYIEDKRVLDELKRRIAGLPPDVDCIAIAHYDDNGNWTGETLYPIETVNLFLRRVVDDQTKTEAHPCGMPKMLMGFPVVIDSPGSNP